MALCSLIAFLSCCSRRAVPGSSLALDNPLLVRSTVMRWSAGEVPFSQPMPLRMHTAEL